ncbi:TIGR03086 family metal-binding protein [Mycobacterium sp. C31M]
MHMLTNNLAPLHRAAVLHSITVVDTVRTAALDRPTPCADWTLADLLAHMTVQHHGFAAATRGNGADIHIWDPATVAAAVRSDPVATYGAAARDALDAFAADGIADAPCALPEFGPAAVVPGSVAMAMHFVDYVVHGWDVAVSLGWAFQPADEIVAAALPIVLAIPDDSIRETADAPFAHVVTTSGTTDFDRLLAHLGRRPDWTQAENSTVTGA